MSDSDIPVDPPGGDWWTDESRALAVWNCLVEVGFEGGEWDEFWGDATIKLYEQLEAWCARGVIFDRLPWPINLDPPAHVRVMTSKACWYEPIIYDCIALVLDSLKVLHATGKGWDPTKGASFPTFLTRGCLYKFANLYGDWSRTSGSTVSLEAIADAHHGEVATTSLWSSRDTCDDIERDDLLAFLDRLPPHDREVVAMIAEQMTYREMSQATGVPERKIRNHVERLKRKHPWLRHQELRVPRERREEA